MLVNVSKVLGGCSKEHDTINLLCDCMLIEEVVTKQHLSWISLMRSFATTVKLKVRVNCESKGN